jgi:hypothetical protein
VLIRPREVPPQEEKEDWEKLVAGEATVDELYNIEEKMREINQIGKRKHPHIK